MRSKDIPWLRVFLEGAVIVGSILLAFALDAWWDERSRRGELRSQLDAVVAEMESTREALRAVLGVHNLNAHLAADLRSRLEDIPEGVEVVVSDTLVGPLFPQATADVTTGSLAAFLAAGGLDLVDEPELRRGLVGWSTRVEDLQDDERYLRNFAAADLASYLRHNFDVANAELRSTPWLFARFGVGPPLDPDLLGTLTLRHDRELVNLLAARESGERGLRPGLEDMIAEASRITQALERLR